MNPLPFRRWSPLLLGLLVVVVIANSLQIFEGINFVFVRLNIPQPSVPQALVTFLLQFSVNVLAIASAAAIYAWRKWGFYGIFVSGAAQIVLYLFAGATLAAVLWAVLLVALFLQINPRLHLMA